MLENKLPEVVNDIENHIFGDEKRPYRASKIRWIVRQYIHYCYLAAIHGFPVGPFRIGKFVMFYKFWDFIPWHLRKRLIFSAKAFGYEFKILFIGKPISTYNYIFHPDGKWKREVRKIIETDAVYDLISEQ